MSNWCPNKTAVNLGVVFFSCFRYDNRQKTVNQQLLNFQSKYSMDKIHINHLTSSEVTHIPVSPKGWEKKLNGCQFSGPSCWIPDMLFVDFFLSFFLSHEKIAFKFTIIDILRFIEFVSLSQSIWLILTVTSLHTP